MPTLLLWNTSTNIGWSLAACTRHSICHILLISVGLLQFYMFFTSIYKSHARLVFHSSFFLNLCFLSGFIIFPTPKARVDALCRQVLHYSPLESLFFSFVELFCTRYTHCAVHVEWEVIQIKFARYTKTRYKRYWISVLDLNIISILQRSNRWLTLIIIVMNQPTEWYRT
jgi:hypothetical protein